MPSITIGDCLVGPAGEGFTITDFLGKGAFGEVYRVVGNKSGTVAAVKLIPVSSLATKDSRVALMNEIRAARQVVHPNVVQVLYVSDSAASPVGPYVFMEYVSGGTLAALLRAQAQSSVQIPLNRAVEMMIDIAQGARAINEKVIHRDIKPDNVLVEENTLKISDFGISKFVDESTRLQTFKGGQHIAYMAPEGWQNQPNTFKLDVYSVGLVFYQILTLQHPLIGKVNDPSSFLDWQEAHLYTPCDDVRSMRNEVPVAIAQLLTRTVSKRPNERPQWAEVLKIISEPEIVGATDHPSVKAAVNALIARKQKEEEQALKSQQKQSERERQLALYRYSCDSLLKKLEPVVEQFNIGSFSVDKLALPEKWASCITGSHRVGQSRFALAPWGETTS